MKKLVVSLFVALFAATAAPAQEPTPAKPSAPAAEVVSAPVDRQVAAEAGKKVDIIMPHITDSHHLEAPCPWRWPEMACEVELPRWAPIHLGPLTLDLSPTKHVVMMWIASFLCCLVLITAAVAHKRHTHEIGRPKGFAAGIEAMVLYIRDQVILANVGPHGYAFVPVLLTFFFMILFCNLLGLIPFGATATGNIAVTATLAAIAFVVIEGAGMKALGSHYISTIVYWNKDLALPLRILLFLIMTPVEFIGKLTKPFALAVRLFANMTAGHVVVLAFIGMIFTFGSFLIGVAPVLMAIGIMVLELFVAFLQAYIFTLLVSVFIGQIRAAHH
jgi:F-type H+-transporting ATPase subunit a